MPRFRKLTAAEVTVGELRSPGSRAAVAQAYDELLADFVAGDYGRVELHDGVRLGGAPALAGGSQAARSRAALSIRPWPADLSRCGGGQSSAGRGFWWRPPRGW
jgi:hypothetical protein